jgi:hypothetical protein
MERKRYMVESARKPRGTPRLMLDSPASARKTLARLSRMRFRGEIASDVYRDLVYGLSTIRSFDSLLADLRIEARIEELEKLAAAKSPGGF